MTGETAVRTDCIFCGSADQQMILSLGLHPLSNSFLDPAAVGRAEPVFPLDLYLCRACGLAHIGVVASSEEIFSDYAYFSSYSTTWLEHSRDYVDAVTRRFGLGDSSFVVELASNDGYLLQYFVERGVPCLGIEPAANVVEAARAKGVPTERAFWSVETARRVRERHGAADLVLGNNVLAHVPALNDFVAGIAQILSPRGVVTMEFPHLERLVDGNQFDTIYHEHFCYFSCSVVRKIFAAHGLEPFDVEELETHGGSLRIYARHAADDSKAATPRLLELLRREEAAGVDSPAYYEGFARKARQVREDLLHFLDRAATEGKRIAGYGAPAKGNTLLNFCGVTAERIPFTVDRSPHKQGRLLPGSRIPILDPSEVRRAKPDYLLILPWNLKDEIMEQMADVRSWGCRFVVAIPCLQTLA